MREGIEGKDDPEDAEIVDEAPALDPPPAPKAADGPPPATRTTAARRSSPQGAPARPLR